MLNLLLVFLPLLHTELALEAQKKAYAPYSNYHIGSLAITKDGKCYTGCNVENASYGSTICGERTAVFKAVSEGDLEITAIVVVSKDGQATPCGPCRQVLNEFNPNMEIVCLDEQGVLHYKTTLDQLLPKAFGPWNLQ